MMMWEVEYCASETERCGDMSFGAARLVFRKKLIATFFWKEMPRTSNIYKCKVRGIFKLVDPN